ncbi:MAG TPA: SDR family NAD(P)-dependent oxidoreductase [Candidatus Elarobacter sp.]|jgi:short-subunit dehydrogenase|nr:SDR family NAD(P)-dependent oxidoreductase [Candidatus Elarobacter sp.]
MSVLLVTGASSGIGRALALRAGRAGYDVVAIGRNAAALDALAERVRAEHARIVTGAHDVAQRGSARAIVDLARRAFGRIDVLVNNAGHVAVGPLSEQSDDALQAQFGTHAIGPVALVREALPLLRASRGHVFMVGSGVARVPVGGLGAYPPSKAATRSATTILRRELKPDGIAVTYVDPGVVDTAFMSRAGMPGAPAPLLVTPEDVARKILLAIGTRPRVLNAVPWQTAFVALGELFPRITDAVLERNPALVGTQDVPRPAQPAIKPPPPQVVLPETSHEAAVAGAAGFEAAIEPVRRRMERVKLREEFVRGLLREGDVLDVHEVALRWAGMPNKNERAATTEVLDALSDAGYLRRDGERYHVVRGPD